MRPHLRRRNEQLELLSGNASVLKFKDRPTAITFLRRFKDDPAAWATLRKHFADHPAIVGGGTDEDLLEALAGEMVSQKLRFLRRSSIPKLPVPVDEKSEQPPPTPAKTTKTYWIEIQLIDQDDAPVAGEPYEVELPDGTKRNGTLDSAGLARITGIPDPGNCKVTFPNCDKTTWDRA